MNPLHLPRAWAAGLLFLLPLLPALRAQDLLPAETTALQQRASGDDLAAAATLLQLAADTARTAGGAVAAARVEAWATAAAELAEVPAPLLVARLDTMQKSPLAAAHPLLADRLAGLALRLAGDRRDLELAARADALGYLRELWLCGPFANERGSGLRTVLPPEQHFDLDAELAGKRRSVSWRHLPARSGQPTWRLTPLVNPHQQSLVYAAVAVLAERDTTAVLELGSTGAFAVFLNGQNLATRDLERPFAPDQDAVSLPLTAGANLLLLKLCHQEGDDFVFAARLRTTTGAPLDGVRLSTQKPDLAAAAGHTPATEVAGGEVPLGARSTWTIGEAQGADALRLAWAWHGRHADGDRDRRDLAAAKAASGALPTVAEGWLLVAANSARHARSAADRDDNDRRRALEQVLQLVPDHVPALVQLGEILRESSGLWREAQALADRALTRCPGHAGALLLRAATLRDQGLESLADHDLAANTTENSPLALRRRTANEIAGQQPRRGLALRQTTWRDSGSEEDAVSTAWLLARTGQADAARDLLRTTLTADPYAARARSVWLEMQLDRGDARAALAELEAWLQLAPDDASAMVTASRANRLLAAQEPEAAQHQLPLLREALAIEPERRDDERYADFLAAGSGSEQSFYTPYQLDAAALVQADAGPPADAAAAKDALFWLLRQRIVRANGNGTTNAYQHDIVRVLTEDGARALSRYHLQHYRGEQRSRLLSCTVFRKNGTVDRPALQGASVRLPDLQPGDTVAVEGRIDDLQPSFFGDYFGLVHWFPAAEGSPVRQSDLLVLAEPGRDYRWQAAHGAPEPTRETLADGTLSFRFTMRDLPRDVPEIRRPDRKELQPLVRMTTYRDWDHFASWWWDLIKHQLEVTPAMRQKVAELCAGKDAVTDKIAAIYHFVTTDVRYEAWEFGVHGYKPYSTAVIYERRHGDCKDKALLLCAMLAQIGVEARPVLIFADPLRSQDDLQLAMVEQFNHCIAWMPEQQGRPARFLDGTAIWHPTGTIPEMDQGADVLVVDRGKALLRRVDYTTPGDNLEASTFTIELAADGKATLQMTERPTGNTAVALREMLATEPARRREVVEQSMVRRFGKLELTDLQASPLDDPEAAVFLTATAKVAQLGQQGDARWQLPSTWDDSNLQALAGDAERHTPVLLGAPQGSSTTVRYKLPPGWRVDALPATVKQEAPFGDFVMAWRRDGDDVVVERSLAFRSPRVGTADYEALRQFVTKVKTADAQLVLLQKEGR